MKTKSVARIANSLAIALGAFLSLEALADIPPAPQPPEPIPPAPVPTVQPTPQGKQKYSLKLDDDMSSLLLSSVNFQSSSTVNISNSTGQCTTQEKTWAAGQQALVCRATTSCISTVPACVMTLTAPAGYGPSDFVTILSATAAATGTSGPNS